VAGYVQLPSRRVVARVSSRLVCGSAAAGSLNETLQKLRYPLPGLASTLPQKPVWTHPVFWLVLSLFGGVAVVSMLFGLYQAAAEMHAMRAEVQRQALVLAESQQRAAEQVLQDGSRCRH
jgi:hypothetical protein